MGDSSTRIPPVSKSFDAVSALSMFVLFLIAIPSELIVGPLGSAGTPAEILGMGMLAGWCLIRLLALPTRNRQAPRQPIRYLMALFAVATVLSYIAATARPMLSDEARQADSGILLLASWLGILLMALDGIRTRERLDVLLRRVVFGAGALASLAILQFATKQPYTNYIQIPGLRVNGSLVAIYGRDGYARPAGTAVHPLEFGALLTMVLPIALHYAFQKDGRTLLRRWYPVAAIAVGIPISISRSAVISTVVVLCFLLPTWGRQARRLAGLAIVGLAGMLYTVVPGLLGTITSLFTGISQDSSAQSRTGSFTLAFEFIHRAPFFGRGLLTFLPAYRILDDQYLGLLIEIGVLGLAAFLGLLISGVVTGLRIRRATPNIVDKSLAISLSAGIASVLLSFATFDAFSFPMAGSGCFLLLGCTGALARLYRKSDDVAPRPERDLNPIVADASDSHTRTA